MTRGRKKDMTLPATRALTQQRDYRARKAQYLSDIERRLYESEAENRRLKAELNAIKNGTPMPPLRDLETVCHCIQLIFHRKTEYPDCLIHIYLGASF
jgi:hypothetical protein